MKNWAENIVFEPKSIKYPKSEEEIISIVKEGKKIRVVGTAHSWTPLISTDETLISLDEYQGVTAVSGDIATVRAGTKLKRLGEELFKHNLAQPNMGDIDVQSIAGAASTGTHGTGITLQSISNQVVELTLITAQGERVVCSHENNSDLFNAARVSFGTLGIITEVKLKLVVPYKLKVQTYPEDVDVCLENLDQLLRDNRNFEFFFFPMGNKCLVKKMNITNEEVNYSPLKSFINDKLLENDAFGLLNNLAYHTGAYKSVGKILEKFISSSSKINWSHRSFATMRSVKFHEMEYGVPLNSLKECLAEMRKVFKTKKFKTLFPIEVRFVEKDTLWLAPTFEKRVAYIAVHSFIKEDHTAYFAAMEKILQKFGGKAHWGKMNTMGPEYLENNYQRWGDFKDLRTQLDPEKKFLNTYLEKLFS